MLTPFIPWLHVLAAVWFLILASFVTPHNNKAVWVFRFIPMLLALLMLVSETRTLFG